MLRPPASRQRQRGGRRNSRGISAGAAALLAPVFLLAGCGSMGPAPGSHTGEIGIHASKTVLDTNATDQLSAAFGSGSPAAVRWSIADGQNDPSLGQGSISTTGLYTPPPLLSRDAVEIEVKATAANDPEKAATYRLTITPGFVQSLTPENASLGPGGTMRISGEIAEIGSGSIHWSLATANGAVDPGLNYGSISGAECRRSPRAYTSCTAIYTAPTVQPAADASVYLVASLPGNPHSQAATHVLLNNVKVDTSPLENQAAQTGYVEMGSSGGNANDYDSSQDARGNRYVNDCCGGTLGALVQDQNKDLYILSNNHVLAESDQARAGDTIVQPALIDLNCNPQAGRPVGSLRYVVPLESARTNVDAALAAATPAVDPGGGILQLGSPANGQLSPAAPAAGSGEVLTASQLNQLRVVKSGRTTGLTCSTVNTIDLSVQVDYYYDCAETRPSYTKTYTNQIGIPGAGFADSGDSGALVLDSSNAQPVGLFFASGGGAGNDSDNGFSVANPIQDVLAELSRESHSAGQQFQIVGGAPHPITCANYDRPAQPVSIPEPVPVQAAAATAAANEAGAITASANGILGISTGRSLDAPDEAAVIVYVDKNKPTVPVPKMIGGLRTVVLSTDETGMSTARLHVDLPQGIHLSSETLGAAARIQQQYAPDLMRDPALFGVGVTQSYDNPAEAALLVLVDLRKTPESMPDFIGGLRVRYLRINRLHVTRSRFSGSPGPTSCQLRAIRR